MRLKQYIKEDILNEVTVKSKKDLTGHTHDATVNADGDGKTTETIGEAEDHFGRSVDLSGMLSVKPTAVR